MKKRLAYIAIGIICTSNLYAQFNPSFEEVDSNSQIVGWQTIQGSAIKASFREVNVLPFTATDRSYFVELIDNTNSAEIKHAQIQNKFGYTNRPKSLSLDVFYLPNIFVQKAKLDLLLKNTSIDTILFAQITINPQRDSIDTNVVRIGWQSIAVDIESLYRNTQMPDTAIITIGSNLQAVSNNPVRLFFADNIRLSDFLSASSPTGNQSISVYPNPAKDYICISGIKSTSIRIINLQGYVMPCSFKQNQIDVSHLTQGLYILQVIDKNGYSYSHKITISR
jgi:hypothetical protein